MNLFFFSSYFIYEPAVRAISRVLVIYVTAVNPVKYVHLGCREKFKGRRNLYPKIFCGVAIIRNETHIVLSVSSWPAMAFLCVNNLI